jgi:dihydrofolate reductase
MRKVIFLMHVSLDGYVAGPNGEMDWIVYNNEVEKYSHDLHDSTDAAIYGRVTYQMMDAYWPTVLNNPEATPSERSHARWYDEATKIIGTNTLDLAGKKNTVGLKGDIAAQINQMKQQAGKDMWLLGSPSLAQAFMRLNLIDDYRLNVNPVILGAGKPLFDDLAAPVKLNLVQSQTFKGGVVALRYAPAQ